MVFPVPLLPIRATRSPRLISISILSKRVTSSKLLERGKEIILNRVLLVKNENELRIGKPYVETAKVTAKVMKHLLGKKTVVYKMRPKKKTRKKQGHRQKITRISIETINLI